MEQGQYKIEDFIFNESFQRYVVQKTLADTQYWESWINQNPDALKVIECAKEMVTFVVSHQKRPNHKNIQDEVCTRLQMQIDAENGLISKNNQNRVFPLFFKYAATVMVLMGLAIAFLLVRNKPAPIAQTADQYIQVIVPQGQRSQLLLPDGTKIWLNSGSIFRCPTEFRKNSRDVYLEGEAFFHVKHNKDMPFIVHLKEKLSVKVLGTEFNVKSYTDEKVIETTLINGSIKLIRENSALSEPEEIELKPNEKAVFEKVNQSINISRLIAFLPDEAPARVKSMVNEQLKNKLEPITAWKEDALVFYNETFQEIAIKMERWYGVSITVTDARLKKERFTGKFANNETIYQVLDIFDRTEPIRYTSDNKQITIEKDNPNN